jgi:hypothetical protein
VDGHNNGVEDALRDGGRDLAGNKDGHDRSDGHNGCLTLEKERFLAYPQMGPQSDFLCSSKL